MAVENKARIWAVMGQSGTGKGVWLKGRLRALKPARLIILDPQDEYGEFATAVTSAAALAKAVAVAGAEGSYRVRYVFPKSCTPSHFERVFDLACQLAYLSRNCVFVVEELSNFTKPSWAPPMWKRMCNSGRHEGVHVIGCSQFPAQVDKSFLSNATLHHVGWLAKKSHREAVAEWMDIDEGQIRVLPEMHYIEWHREGRRLFKGEVSVTGRCKEVEITERGDEKTTAKKGIAVTKRSRTST
jgi:hypothetical protein